jgi:F-type H+-transporting ATPase subunit delta
VATETTGLTGLAERYAVALYDLAESAGKLDEVARDLRDLKRMIDESDDLRRLIRSAQVSRAAQGKALAALLKQAGASDLVQRFVGVISENRRLFALPQIIAAYLDRLAGKRGEITAHVTTATALDERQLGAVTEALKKALGTQKIVLDQKVDAGLIGGLVVRIGSKLVDNSLKTKLTRLERAMKGVG